MIRNVLELKIPQGIILSETKCHKRTNEMENQILASLSYPAMVRKDCIKVKLKAA